MAAALAFLEARVAVDLAEAQAAPTAAAVVVSRAAAAVG